MYFVYAFTKEWKTDKAVQMRCPAGHLLSIYGTNLGKFSIEFIYYWG